MRVLAYSAASFKNSARQAAGVEPLTCPPFDANHLPGGVFEGYDLLYFDLHGLPGLDYWFEEVTNGQGMTTRIKALTAEQIKQMNLKDAVIFATNCHLGDEDSPMLDALLDAGAAYVIGGPGKNWANRNTLSGAAALGQFLRLGLEWGFDTLQALSWAKKVLPTLSHIGDELADTLEFKAYTRRRT